MSFSQSLSTSSSEQDAKEVYDDEFQINPALVDPEYDEMVMVPKELHPSYNPDIAEHFFKTIHEKFLTYGIDTNLCDGYEHALLYTIQNISKQVLLQIDAISLQFLYIFPVVLTDLILDYLDIYLYKKYKTEINDLIPKTTTHFANYDNSTIIFSLPLNKTQGEFIEKYFNSIKQNSAQIITKELSYIRINISVAALENPELLLRLDETLQTIPQPILDNFRKESKQISLTTAQCLEKLTQAKKIIPEEKMKTLLPHKIDALIKHINLHGLEQAKHKEAREKLIKEIDIATNDLIQQNSKLLNRLPKFLNSPLRLFSSLNNKKSAPETDIRQALEGINCIANKNFAKNQPKTASEYVKRVHHFRAW